MVERVLLTMTLAYQTLHLRHLRRLGRQELPTCLLHLPRNIMRIETVGLMWMILERGTTETISLAIGENQEGRY